MKKILFLLTSLLAVSCAACFVGCTNNGGDKANDDVQTKIVTVEDENDDECPNCEDRGMPKVRFEFKNGRPAGKGDGEGVEPPYERHHKKHPRPPKRPAPLPPEDGGQDKNEN